MLISNNTEEISTEEKKTERDKGIILPFSPKFAKIGTFLSSLIIAGSILCSIMILIFSIDKIASYPKNYPTGLVSKEESFTALYFENSENLPGKVAKGEKIDFSFTIKNMEGTDKEYEYEVYLKNGTNNKRVAVDRKKIWIKNGGSATIPESYTFQQDHMKEILIVELRGENQKIHFILTNDNQNQL